MDVEVWSVGWGGRGIENVKVQCGVWEGERGGCEV